MADVLPATELLRGYIEPQAVDLRVDHDGQIRLSIAISLKRIADALWGDDATSGVVQLLNGIEMNGRQN